MTMTKVEVSTTLHTVSCSCGGVYAITEAHRAQAEREGTCWTCPYCRTSWGFSGRGTNATLKRELESQKRATASAQGRANRFAAAAEHQTRRASTYKGHLTRTKKRVAEGVCPCCTRTFKNLKRHMDGQHPDYVQQPDG